MSDMVREIIYTTFVVMLIASVWALGWEKSHTDALERDFGPVSAQSNWPDTDSDESRGLVTSTFDPEDE